MDAGYARSTKTKRWTRRASRTLSERRGESGCEGVVALGVMGEAHRLTDAEGRGVAEAVISAAKRDAGDAGNVRAEHDGRDSADPGGQGDGCSRCYGRASADAQDQPGSRIRSLLPVGGGGRHRLSRAGLSEDHGSTHAAGVLHAAGRQHTVGTVLQD